MEDMLRPPKSHMYLQATDCSSNVKWVPPGFIACSQTCVDVGKSPNIPYVYIQHQGEVQNYKPLQVVTACSLDIYNFPFDIQNCSLTFTSWLHTSELWALDSKAGLLYSLSVQDINISLWRSPEKVKFDKSVFMNQGEWELLGVLPYFREFSVESSHSYAEMKFYVSWKPDKARGSELAGLFCRACLPQASHKLLSWSQVVIRRRPLFYVVSLLLPSIFLMIMDIVGFYLPPNSGERVSFKITLLLGYSVFLIIVSDTLPATAIGTPLIGKSSPGGRAQSGEKPAPSHFLCVSLASALGCTGVYFVVCMALLVISLTETIFIVRLVHKQDLQQPVPAWLRHLVLERITWLLCLREQSTSHRSPATSQATKTADCSVMENHCSHVGGPQDLEKSLRNRCSPPPPPREASFTVSELLQELSSIRHFLEKQDEIREVAQDWLHVGSMLDKLLFRIYLLAVLAYSITLITLWSVWQYA
ncbi:5-hydroxytryptamine receptor 3A [Saguinus oedipus]|uniref:5-hydroxytryptamine receptor 3A n=1 Tax=Saguinus oedipus TaxID=9490 RepID=A0ABQ9URP4_SAGOE|nr:5-hydroxytryptamine receptor 3A [Saguinus oedipus]